MPPTTPPGFVLCCTEYTFSTRGGRGVVYKIKTRVEITNSDLRQRYAQTPGEGTLCTGELPVAPPGSASIYRVDPIQVEITTWMAIY